MMTIRPLLSAFAALTIAAGARAATNATTLISRYEKVSAALVADNLAGARSAAQALVAGAENTRDDAIAGAAQAVAKAGDLAAAREAFKTLSVRVIPLARQQRGLFIVNCPMANADWVQDSRTIANPYLGKDMSACGTVTEETKG
jgi:hypothetical protein